MRRAISRRHGGQARLVYFVVLFGFGLGVSGVAAHSRFEIRFSGTRGPRYGAQGVEAMVQRGGRTSIREGVDRGPQIPLTSHGDTSGPRLLIVTLPDDLAAGPVVIGYHIFLLMVTWSTRSLPAPYRNRANGSPASSIRLILCEP
jgi:hypothetical protein